MDILLHCVRQAKEIHERISKDPESNTETDTETESARCTCACELLNALYQLLNDSCISEPDNSTLYLSLLVNTFRPYMEMLDSWLQEGTFVDPHDEFIIIADPLVDVRSSLYWTRGHRLRKSIPVFLAGSAQRILLAGKSLLVMQLISKVLHIT